MEPDPPDEESPESAKGAVVEQSPAEVERDVAHRSLAQRIRQQELLAELGVAALRHTSIDELLDRAVQVAAEGLLAEFCKVLEHLPAEGRLLLRAGVGWDPGLVGKATVSADLESPAGFALHTGKPVISNQLDNEERFRTPDLLKAHGVRRAINVILQGDGAAFGVLEVDSRSEGAFTEHDIAFLQGAANILGMAIERQRREQRLRQALDRQTLLVNEISHRVRNSLQLVASLLNLQATAADSALKEQLHQAVSRVTAVARVHERLYRSADIEVVDLADYLRDICQDFAALATHCAVRFEAEEHFQMETDRAVRVALLATELVSNAAKHAYPSGTSGEISVRLRRSPQDDGVVLSVRDHGQGLAADFDPEHSSGLGMKVIRTLTDQSDATLSVVKHDPGTEFIVEIAHPPRSTELSD